MLKIYVPEDFAIELTYVINVLLKEQLNFHEFFINTGDGDCVTFEHNECQIKFANVFFKGEVSNLHTKENLPVSCIDFSYNGYRYKTLYAENNIIEKSDFNIALGPDIFASTYFLLTQWESILLEGDHLGRYKLSSSTIKKFDLYNTPIVNEYVQLIQQLLHFLGITTKTSEYKPHFSCDVDSITKYKSLRNLFGGIYHTRKPICVLQSYISSQRNKNNDPYFSFDYIFSKLDKYNIDATFYFMAAIEDRKIDTKDYDLDEPLIQEVFSNIKKRNYKIGLHPTINAWRTYNTIREQKMKLENASGEKIINIRQHYLRYDVSTTWDIMDNNAFQFDSSMQFTEGLGFAAGICTLYTLFDIKNRRATNVKEIPLLVMKKKDYVQNVDQAFSHMQKIIDQAKKHNGQYMILFHNSDLETPNERMLFEKILEYI